MKKNIGNAIALYPTPLVVVGAMLDAKGNPDYHRLKPVLFEMPTYEYLKTGDMLGQCMSFAEKTR